MKRKTDWVDKKKKSEFLLITINKEAIRQTKRLYCSDELSSQADGAERQAEALLSIKHWISMFR